MTNSKNLFPGSVYRYVYTSLNHSQKAGILADTVDDRGLHVGEAERRRPQTVRRSEVVAHFVCILVVEKCAQGMERLRRRQGADDDGQRGAAVPELDERRLDERRRPRAVQLDPVYVHGEERVTAARASGRDGEDVRREHSGFGRGHRESELQSVWQRSRGYFDDTRCRAVEKPG